ncbi:hypothetical protein ACQSSU_29330 [Micromonospora echinospora]
MPGHEGAVAALIGLQAGLLGILVVTTLQQSRRSRTAAASWLGGLASPVRLADTDGEAATRLALATDVGMYVIGLVALGTVALGLLSYRPEETRRTIAVIWDLGTFWPRTVHPFAPPCYAERAVPELAKRITPIFSAHRPDEPPRVAGPAGTVDRRLRDPRGLTVDPDDTVPPPIHQHWPYHTEEAYAAAVRELAARLDPDALAPDPRSTSRSS